MVSVALSGERRYQGNRVLHVSRPADVGITPGASGESGISVTQHTNFIPMALVRLSATYYKPVGNANTLVLRLRRSIDGHIVYEEQSTPSTDYWTTWTTPFVEIPPTLSDGGFDLPGLRGWTGGGLATWTWDGTVGRDGLGSAKLLTGPAAAIASSSNDGTATTDIPDDLDGTSDTESGLDNMDGTGTMSGGVNPYTDGSLSVVDGVRTDYGVLVVEGADRTDGTIDLVDPDAVRSTLSTEKMNILLDNTVRCSAWVRWQNLATTVTSPVIYIRAVYYSSDGDIISYQFLDGAAVSSPSPSLESDQWVPIGGALYVPSGLGVSEIAFQIVIENVADGASIWVDDVLVDVPGADRQTYELSLTMKGDAKDSIYVSDLYSEIAPIRYFVRLGGLGSYQHEVTDLRHAATGWAKYPGTDEVPVSSRATVTAPSPVNQIGVTAMILTPRAVAFGCAIRPHYLK